MTSNEPTLERLARSHNVGDFNSSKADLDRWLERHAGAAQEMDSARTFVLVLEDRVIGYFSLAMGSVLREKAPARLVRGLPRYPVGAVILARLAVDLAYQGQGFGSLLLAESLRKAVTAGEAAAARLVVVDANDDAAIAFYERNGFIRIPEYSNRLYRRLKDIRASL